MFMPIYVTFLGIFSLSSLAFPGTNSFVGEFLVLLGAFEKYPLVGAVSILGAILAAAYMLRLLQKMVWDDSDGHGHHDHGDDHGDDHALTDCNFREIIQLAFLTVFVFWIGFHPTPLLDMMDTSVAHLIHQIDAGSAVHEAVQHGEHHALLNNAGAWVKNLF
jgi:NADH-quinone oxidoreductase subunit M